MKRKLLLSFTIVLCLALVPILTACSGKAGAIGPQGPQGEQGIQGGPGLKGDDGLSAFDIWFELYGNEGDTEEDFLNWLKDPLTHTHPEYENPAAHTHSYGNEWTSVIAATCTSQGMEKRVCSCGNMEVRTMNKLGHDLEVVYTDNTATVDGTMTTTCKREDCAYTKTEVSASAGLTFDFVPGSNNMEYGITDYTGSSTEVIIPAIHNGKPVTTIREFNYGNWNGAFQNKTAITSVKIPKSVTFIGSNSFSGCTSLTAIYFNGTFDEWNAILKGGGWFTGIPVDVVNCTDGVFPF